MPSLNRESESFGLKLKSKSSHLFHFRPFLCYWQKIYALRTYIVRIRISLCTGVCNLWEIEKHTYHCGTTPTEDTNIKPIPKPNANPWERKSCQILVDQEAPKSPAVSNMIPILSDAWVPYRRQHIVATGDTIKAIDMDSPPIKAYSRGVAPGYVSKVR